MPHHHTGSAQCKTIVLFSDFTRQPQELYGRTSLPCNANNMTTLRLQDPWTCLLLSFIVYFFPHKILARPATDPLSENRTAGQITAVQFFHFPDSKQAENIKPRLNGQLLVTLDTAPELWQINPYKNQTGGLVHAFIDKTAVFGIVESTPDSFHVIASNFTGPPDYYGSPGTVSIFEVDLRETLDPTSSLSAVKVSKVLDIPQAQLLDGLVLVNQADGLLMSGDAQEGTLYLIDVRKRIASVVLSDPLLIGTTQAAAAGLGHVGINGMKLHDGDLYFTNTAKGLYGRIPIDITTGQPIGKPSIIANYGTDVDDLSFDSAGDQFISEDEKGVLLRPVTDSATENRTRLIAVLPGSDANAFGRTERDKRILYQTFQGAPSGVAAIYVGQQGFCS